MKPQEGARPCPAWISHCWSPGLVENTLLCLSVPQLVCSPGHSLQSLIQETEECAPIRQTVVPETYYPLSLQIAPLDALILTQVVEVEQEDGVGVRVSTTRPSPLVPAGKASTHSFTEPILCEIKAVLGSNPPRAPSRVSRDPLTQAAPRHNVAVWNYFL